MGYLKDCSCPDVGRPEAAEGRGEGAGTGEDRWETRLKRQDR